MTKPIGFYAPYPIGTGCILEEIEKEWGSYFENLTSNEKFWLLAQISRSLWVWHSDVMDVRDGVMNAAAKIHEQLPPDHRIGMIEALCDQLKNDN